MEKQNITINDECSGFRAQFYSPRSEFIYDIIESLASAKINGKFHLSFCGLTFEKIPATKKSVIYSLDSNVRDFAKQKS